MMQITLRKYQWLIDLLFGFVVIAPLVVHVSGVLSSQLVFMAIGSGAAYFLHVTWKMLMWEDIMRQSAEEEVERHVPDMEERAKEKAQEVAENVVKDVE